MPRQAHHHVLRPFVAAILALAFLPWITPAQEVSAQTASDPHINLYPVDDVLHGQQFAADTSVTVSRNGEVVGASSTDGGGFFSFDARQLGIDFQVGDIVAAFDGTTTKDVVVTDLAVTTVEWDVNRIGGVASSAIDVVAWVDGVDAYRTVAGGGSWTVDFGSPGSHPDDRGIADLSPGTRGNAGQWDAEGDSVEVSWWVPNPAIAAETPNRIWASSYDWTPGSTVAITVDDDTDPGNGTLYEATAPVEPVGANPTDGSFDHVTDGFTIVPGHVVTVASGDVTKVLTVLQLDVTAIDLDNDVVTGTATPGSPIEFWLYDEGGGALRTPIADAVTGEWEADFSAPAPEDTHTLDLRPGVSGYAKIFDDDNDSTTRNVRVPNPTTGVDPWNVWGNEFLTDTAVTVSLDGVVIDTATTDEWGNFGIGYDQNAAAVFEPGDTVLVTDGVTTKEHVVTDLAVTTVDPDTDTVSGTAAVGTEVAVWVHDTNADRNVVAVDGTWTADFANPGVNPGDNDTADLVAGSNGNSNQCDDDGDCTQFGWRVDNPTFSVAPAFDQLWGNEFAPDSPVTITVDGQLIDTVTTDEWGNFNSSDLSAHDIQAGDAVEVSDGLTTKTHVVTALTTTSVDPDTNIVSGAADAGSEVSVWVDDSDANVSVPSDGNWTADFDGLADLVDGSSGGANQCDVDGDCTQASWSVADPWIIASVSHEEIWAENWPNDPLGQTLFFELDDPATPGIDVSGDMPLLVTPWGTEAGDRSFGTYDIQAGMTLTVRNRPFGEPLGFGVERYLDVSHIVVTDVDADADAISGYADEAEGGYLCVWSQDAQLCSDEAGFFWDTGPAGTGDFFADFGSVGSDVAPGHWNEASQYDDDGDRTHFWWNLPPWVVVNLAPEDAAGDPLWPDEVRAESWIGPVVTLTVNGSFVADITVSGSEHDQETIELPGLDIEPGDVVTLSDSHDTKSITVEPLRIEEVNFSTDFPPNTIDGSADSYRNVRVEVTASVGGRWAERWVNADVAGDFTADFGTPGNGWREQWTADLGGPQGLGRNVRLEIYDSDNDRVETTHCEGVPRIEVSRFDNRVTVFDYPQGTSVTIEIDDPNTTESPDYTATGISTPNPENPCETIIVFDVVDYVIPEEVTVVVSDGTPEGTITHDTIAFTIDLIDPDSDQIGGTAPAGVEVLVEADGNWRYVTADQFDSWIADFSVAGTEPGEEQTVDIGPGSSGRAIVVDQYGNATELTWWIPASNFSVDPTTENLWANEFEPDSAVTVTVNGTEAPGSPFGADGWGNFSTGFDPNDLDLLAGDLVVVSDGTTDKDHTITPLTVATVDPVTNEVTGFAEPGTEVWVYVHGHDVGRAVTASDPTGLWTTDFDLPGDDGGTLDLVPGDWAGASQCDADNDCTQVDRKIPNVNFQVDPFVGSIWANEFEPNSEISITVDGADAGSYPTDGWGNFDGNNFGLSFDVPAGSVVVVSDVTTTKDHVVTDLAVTGVDPVSDTITGTAAPGGVLSVWEHSTGSQLEVQAGADRGDGLGDWVANFSGLVDLEPGSNGNSRQCDDDNDCTQVGWQVRNANFQVDPTTEGLWANEFEPDSLVTVTVNGAEVPGSPFSADGGGNFATGFDPNELNLSAGDEVVVSDGTSEKSHTITALTITDLDPGANVIAGTTDAETDVCVDAWGYGQQCVTATGGNWSIDADDVGVDLQPGDQGNVSQYDADNDATQVYWRIANASFQVIPAFGVIVVNEFEADSSVTITIDGTEVGTYPTDGGGNFYSNNFGVTFDVQVGSEVSVTDDVNTKTHEVTELALAGADPVADTVSGTAAIGAEVCVDVWGWGQDCIVATDGTWTIYTNTAVFNFADLQPGDQGLASEADDDGDSTAAFWLIVNPRFSVNPTSEGVWGAEFTPGAEVTVTVNAAAAPGSPFETDGWGNFGAGFDPSELDLAAGDTVIVSDGDTTKTHLVTNLTVTGVDVDTDTVTGTADPGSEVCVGLPQRGESCVIATGGIWSVSTNTPDFGYADLQPGDQGYAAQRDDDGDETFLDWRISNASFQVDPISEQVWANEFAPNSPVWVTVNGVEAPGSPASTDDNGNVNFGFDPNELDLTDGDDVEVSDGTSEKDHMITRLVVDLVDLETNEVAGTADPYTEVWVDVHNVPDAGRTVTADATGKWATDFDTPGDGGGTFDVGTGQGGYAAQCDDDGDCTWINWQVANPTISVETPSQVWASNGDWNIGATVTVTVDDDEDPDNGVLLETSTDVEEWGFQLDTDPFVIEPDHVVTVTDGDTTKSLVVVDLRITHVDQDLDVVSGTAPAGVWVEVDVGNEFGGVHRAAQADGDGNWSADFANPAPDQPDTIDIQPGLGVSAQVFDDDADSTHRGINIENPQFGVSAEHDAAHGDGWAADAEITITVDADEDPGNGVLYSVQTGTGGEGHFEVEFGDEFDLEIGQFVTITDGFGAKTHQVKGIAVTEVDPDADTVRGTAEPGAAVDVRVDAPLTIPIWEQLAFQFGPGRFDRNADSLTEYDELRRAVAHAIDRDALVAAIPGAGYAIDSYLDAILPALSTDAWAQYPYDPALASALIDSLCVDLARDCATDPPVVVFTTTEESPDRVLMADLLRQMLADVGIEMVIDLEPAWEFFGTTVPDGTYDAGEWAFGSDPTFDGLRAALGPMDPEQRWSESNYRWGTPDSAVNNAGTERFAELLGLMYGTDDPVELAAYSAEAEQILADQLVFIPLYVRAEGIESEQQPFLTVTADEFGNWTADFSGYFDLTLGHEGSAAELDDDGDYTFVGWHVPNPTFGVHPPEHIASGGASTDWNVGATMTVTVDDDDPTTPALFEGSTQVEPWGFYINTGSFVIEPGHVVTVIDGETTKVHDVVDLTIAEVDEDLDAVFGTAPPNSWVNLDIEDGATGEWVASRSVEADPTGHWTADFSVPGDDEDEQETADLGPDTLAHASVFDDDGDFTGVHFGGPEPPEVTDVAGPAEPVQIGSEVAVLATFTDPDADDVHVAEFDWGDGTSSAGDVSFSDGSGTAVGYHEYSSPGVYSVTVVVTDAMGLEADGVFEFVVVYDPDGGFVTGGGWIRADGATSDPGDTYPGIEADDTVNFGFNAKYTPNKTFPTGQVNVQLGALHLHGEQIDWLVVSPSGTAIVRGAATIDGSTELHPFAVTIIDGKIAGGDDRFEIRVALPGESPFSSEPLYQATGDNQGGQIKIHAA